MNRLYKDLEAVEGARFRDLNFLAEPLHLLDETQKQKQFFSHHTVETEAKSDFTGSCFNNVASLQRHIRSKKKKKTQVWQLGDMALWFLLTRFSLTMPSLAAKKAKMCEMKCFSSGFRRSQWAKSLDRSTWKWHRQHSSPFHGLFMFYQWWWTVVNDSVSLCCNCWPIHSVWWESNQIFFLLLHQCSIDGY